MRPEEAEGFFVYQYLIVARPAKVAAAHAEKGNGFHEADCNGAINPVLDHNVAGQTKVQTSSDILRVAFPGTLEQPRSTESYAADALERIGGTLRFWHRRKLGDIIYSLPAIRHLGGGVLYLDPTSFNGAQDQAYWRRLFATLIPYLEQQPYLRDVRIYQGEDFDIDLDVYRRTTHETPGDRVTIVANHFIGLGLEVPKEFSLWLVADNATAAYPIVVHRSPRYHGSVDHSFLYEVDEDLFCVGSAEERAPFEAIGARPVITKDVRKLAAVINGCGVFIGNQSLPLALVAGLGKPRMIEESNRLPNVTFGGPNEHVLTNLAAQNLAGLRRLLKRSSYCAVSLPQVATTAIG